MWSEKKIDRIEDRLTSLEKTLKSVAESLGLPHQSSFNTPVVSNTPSAITEPKLHDEVDTDNEDSTFEGASSLTAHVAHAKNLVVNAMKSVDDTGLSSTMNDLRRIALRRREPSHVQRPTFRTQKPTARFCPSSLRLPPSEVVMAAIKDRNSTRDPPLDIDFCMLIILVR